MIKIILGAGLLLVGIYLIVKSVLVKKQGVYIEGVVTGYRNKEGHMFPMVNFTYNGEELDYIASCAHKKPKFSDNTPIKGYFVEKDNCVYIEGENAELKNGLFIAVCGLAILVLCLI